MSYKYNTNFVSGLVDVAVGEMTNGATGFYAPLMERFPLVYHDLPKTIEDNLREHGSPACTDATNVYVSVQILTDLLNDFSEEEDAKGQDYRGTRAVPDVIAIIAHEYNHILCQHIYQGQKMNKRHGMDSVQTRAFMTACEIEANRGYLIGEDTLAYRHAVTDTAIPVARGLKYLPQIYEAVLADYRENSDGSSGSQEGDQSSTAQNSSSEGSIPKTKDIVDNAESREASITPEKLHQDPDDLNAPFPGKGEPNPDGMGGGEEDGIPDPSTRLNDIFNEWRNAKLKQSLAKLKSVIAGTGVKVSTKTYSRPSRKDAPDDLMKKGIKRSPQELPRILIALDSSGSMDDVSTAQATSAILDIFKTLGRPKKGCYICNHTSHIHNTAPLSQWEDTVSHFLPCGGNDFSAVMQEALNLDVDVVLNVGDGLDTTTRRLAVQEEFKARGIKWFDVNIRPRSDAYFDYSRELEDDKTQARPSTPITRTWIDLTGRAPATQEGAFVKR